MRRKPRNFRDERGAVLAMVCVIMVVAIGCAAFAVDTGNAWAAKRQLRTATDAAALAAAAVYSANGNGCGGTDDSTLTANDSAASVTSCSPVGQSGTTPGRVTVTAERTIDFAFAQIFGISGGDVGSSTTARWGNADGAWGLRPMALCLYANPDLEAWMNLPNGPTADSGTIRILYNKDHPDACGTGAPGNWGMLDFNGGENSNAETKQWVSDGYPEVVPLSPPSIPGDTGSFNPSIDTELGGLVGDSFALPIFDNVTGTGSNATFDIVAFVWVKLIDYRVNGSESDRYLDLQFQAREVIQGTCCSTSGGQDTGVRAVRICATDPGHDEACVSEDGS